MESFPTQAGVIDVTVPFSDKVPVWPTHPATAVEPIRRIALGHPSNVSRLSISTHTGTHVDAHWHYIDDGTKLLDIPLTRWNGPCHVVRVPDEVRLIESAHLAAARVPPGTERLLLRTANSGDWARWARNEPLAFRKDYVALTPAAARWIMDHGVKLVGFDYLSVGPFGEANRETHIALLGNDVLIVETLDLSSVDPGPYELICLPRKLEVGDGAPARVLLVRPG